MILKAYVLPHPPIVLPEIGRGEEKKNKRHSRCLSQSSPGNSRIRA